MSTTFAPFAGAHICKSEGSPHLDEGIAHELQVDHLHPESQRVPEGQDKGTRAELRHTHTPGQPPCASSARVVMPSVPVAHPLPQATHPSLVMPSVPVAHPLPQATHPSFCTICTGVPPPFPHFLSHTHLAAPESRVCAPNMCKPHTHTHTRTHTHALPHTPRRTQILRGRLLSPRHQLWRVRACRAAGPPAGGGV